MACEFCPKCGHWGTPWHFSEEMQEHICFDCYREESEEKKIKGK